MVKLIVIVRCVPEDVYLRSLESPTPAKQPDIKKFKLVVRDPEQWYIGRLAIEIKTRYESTYGRPLGEIKYLKDDDDDCDLDPELFVADLLVDEGKAARDGADQKKTVKVVQERGHAVRQGSVIPDLTPSHYQPPTRPPIPRFPDVLEKRRTEDRQNYHRPTKRRRLDQIEEETNHIVDSIERDALNGNLNDNGPEAELKQESPELARTWINTGPATIDELELLPEAPPHFKPGSRTDARDTTRRQGAGAEIRESSAIPQEDQQHQRNETSNQEPDSATAGFVREQSNPIVQAPVTPHNAESSTQSPGGRAVSMLNSMKSNSPLPRQSASASANRFRKPVKNVYDYPESDIDDTQMSPRSRASRTRITPKLVPTPFSKNTPRSNDASHRRDFQQSSVMQESPTQQNRNHEDHMDMDRDKENHLPLAEDQETSSHTKSNNQDKAPDAGQVGEITPGQSVNTDKISILGSDETWSIHEDGTKTRKKRPRQSRTQRRSTGNASTPRSSSAVSSDKATPAAGNSTQQKPEKRKRTVPTRVSDVHSRSEISELDSPGMQLSETLRQSSPVARPSKESSQNTSEAVSRSTHASQTEHSTQKVKDVEMDDIERLPDSVSEDEDMPLMKTPKRPKTRSKPSSGTKTVVRKCFTCWGKQSICDNVTPKCGACTRHKKTCQIRDMTQDEALAEKAKRQTEKALKSSQKSGKNKGKPDPQLSQNVVSSASDREDDSDDQQKTSASGEAQSQNTISQRKSNETPSEIQSSKAPLPASDEYEASEPKNESRTPRSSQSTTAKSKSRKKSAATPSKSSVNIQNSNKDIENDDSIAEPKNASVPANNSQSRVKPASGSKKKVQIDTPMHNTQSSPNAAGKQGLNERVSELSGSFEVQASIEGAAPATPAVSKEPQSALANNSATRERSIESHATSIGRVLPPGMTDEEYEALRGARANLTDAQRIEKNLQMRRLGKNRDSTPSLRHESSTQDLIERSKHDTSSIKSSQQAPPSSRSTSKNQSKPPPSTQPARAPTSIDSSTPSSAPAKSRPNPPAANTSAKTKLKLQPAANTSAKTKSPNPPFQPHQPQASSSTQRKPITGTSLTAMYTASPSLNTSRSLKDVRAALQSQSRSGSGTNTPQPASSTAARIAEMRRIANTAATKKKMFSLSDDDDDDSSASDEEKTDDEEDKKVSNKTTPKAVNGNGRSNVTVRRRTPSDSESSGDSETASGSEDEDDSDGE